MSRLKPTLLLAALSVAAFGVASTAADAGHWQRHDGRWYYYDNGHWHFHNGGTWFRYDDGHWHSHDPWNGRYYEHRSPYYREYDYRPYGDGYYQDYRGYRGYGFETPWGNFYFRDD